MNLRKHKTAFTYEKTRLRRIPNHQPRLSSAFYHCHNSQDMGTTLSALDLILTQSRKQIEGR